MLLVNRRSGIGHRIMHMVWDMSNMHEGHPHGDIQEASSKILLCERESPQLEILTGESTPSMYH